MNGDPNVYSALLLFAFICGIALRAFRDTQRITTALLFPNEQYYSIRTLKRSPPPPAPPVTKAILLHQDQEMTEIVKKLSPAPPSRKQLILNGVADVTFAIVSATVTVLLFYQFNKGVMRGFVIPVMLTGYALYAVTLSRPLTALCYLTVYNVARILWKLLWFVTAPLRRLTAFGIKLFLRATKNAKKKKTRKRSSAAPESSQQL